MSKGNILITGGAGFIGSHIADNLLNKGYNVTILDNLKPQVHSEDIKDKNGWPNYLNSECRFIQGDVCDPAMVRKSLNNITHVAHLAAAVGVGQSMFEIVDYTRTNALGTAVLLEELSKGHHKVKRLVVASSMSIYGEGAYQTKSGRKIYPKLRDIGQLRNHQWELKEGDEKLFPIPTSETKPLDPASIYAVGKRDQEEMCLVTGKSLKIPTIALRFFNTYGPRQALSNPYTGAAAIFISQLINNKAPLIFEDGMQKRDFIHVSDIAAAFATVLTSSKEVWDVYNVGSGIPLTISEIANTLAKLLGKSIKPQILGQYRMGDIRHCYSDTSKLFNHFGFRAQISLDNGMKDLIAWVGNQKTVDLTSQNMSLLKKNKLIL